MKAIQSTYIFLLIIVLVPNLMVASPTPKEEPIILNSKLLAIADGKLITEQHIGFTLQIRRDLNNMLIGQKDAQGHHKGLFTLENKLYSIKELLKLELEHTAQAQTLHNASVSSEPKQALATLNHKKMLLQQCLDEVRRYFIVKILPFAEHAQGIQDLMFSLIADSCEQRHRPESFLLTWAECPPGKEAELLTKEMKSFQTLDVFITDLIHFLTDFVNSCPKARKQFLAMIKEKNEHTQKNSV